MRIVVWNCNMAFHRKFERLLSLRPDIAVVPECADIDVLSRKAPNFNPASSIWIGDLKNKGLGIFTFGSFRASKSNIHRDDFPYIVPAHIEGPVGFNLLAVWACHNLSNSYAERRGPLMRSLEAYRDFMSQRPTVVAGDFNDNIQWDRPNRLNTHSGWLDCTNSGW